MASIMCYLHVPGRQWPSCAPTRVAKEERALCTSDSSAISRWMARARSSSGSRLVPIVLVLSRHLDACRWRAPLKSMPERAPWARARSYRAQDIDTYGASRSCLGGRSPVLVAGMPSCGPRGRTAHALATSAGRALGSEANG